MLVDAGGVAIAVKLGEQGGLGISVGISVAINKIDDTVQADIDHAVASGTSVAVQATSEAKIEALTIAGGPDREGQHRRRFRAGRRRRRRGRE